MFKKAILGAVLVGTLAVTGCTSHKTERLEKLSGDVATLNQKVDQLQSDVDVMKQDVLIVRGEAARANQRLDNQATSYRK
ncbi:TPA: murein lipoprotein [Enterobacter asburiae]|nr:hypothetical protein EspYZU15_81 [Cronobacter phage EspYZU15]WAK45487.1 hypothetical protein EspYZU14_83 [Cronobacter phage EspYZU14]WBF78270.1 hypothetical protein [Cronobacter phage EspYZU12]WNT48127.1 hypothetical protein SPLA5a_PHROGS00044 [Salmonella phage SPLA5a]HDR2377016.1 murein lipoprotein [Enterobacter asburiae]